jgi:hypothetical protein
MPYGLFYNILIPNLGLGTIFDLPVTYTIV